MNIGIIFLANGTYSIFIDNLIESCEKYFLPNFKKEFSNCKTLILKIKTIKKFLII